jgi:hypothetical protein
VGKPKEKRPLGRPKCRWRVGIGWILGRLAGGVEWIQLAQDRGQWRALVNTVMNLRWQHVVKLSVPRSSTISIFSAYVVCAILISVCATCSAH